MKRYFSLNLSITLFLLALFVPVLVFAQPAVPVDVDNVTAILQAFLAAIAARDWMVVTAAVLVAIVWVVRRFAVKWIPWLSTDEGGTVLNLFVWVALGFAAALWTHTAITVGLAKNVVLAAATAAGGWSMVRRLLRLLVPVLAKVWPKGAELLALICGADIPAEVAKATDAAYKPAAPQPTLPEVGKALDKPPGA